MSTAPRVRVYLGCSLDGYIAGPDDDLSWLQPPDDPTAPPADPASLGFEAFLDQVGALLMGRRTHDVVAGFGHWPYGDRPVLVATHRPLTPAAPTVRVVSGDIDALIDQGLAAAGGRDLYVDGGDLVRQALRAERVDTLTLSVLPILLGGGVRLFDGDLPRQALRFTGHHDLGHGIVQITADVKR
jgi:dihydrofolate reductase